MPGPYDKFETAFETFQEQLKELLTIQHTELLEALRSMPPAPQPAPKSDPLAFYEVILKVRSQPHIGHGISQPENPPYFADVFNDIISYFGGADTTDPVGQRFISEAKKRFAYLKNPDDQRQLYTELSTTLARVNGEVIQSLRGQGEDFFTIWGNPEILFDFDERDFAVLRQLLVDIFSAEEEKTVLSDFARLTTASPQKNISSDLADLLRKPE